MYFIPYIISDAWMGADTIDNQCDAAAHNAEMIPIAASVKMEEARKGQNRSAAVRERGNDPPKKMKSFHWSSTGASGCKQHNDIRRSGRMHGDKQAKNSMGIGYQDDHGFQVGADYQSGYQDDFQGGSRNYHGGNVGYRGYREDRGHHGGRGYRGGYLGGHHEDQAETYTRDGAFDEHGCPANGRYQIDRLPSSDRHQRGHATSKGRPKDGRPTPGGHPGDGRPATGGQSKDGHRTASGHLREGRPTPGSQSRDGGSTPGEQPRDERPASGGHYKDGRRTPAGQPRDGRPTQGGQPKDERPASGDGSDTWTADRKGRHPRRQSNPVQLTFIKNLPDD